MMKILVTGGTGVIGEGTVPALLKAGYQVRLLARGAGRKADEYPEGVEAFQADVTTPEELVGAAEGCEAVVHVTGIVEELPPEVTFQAVNINGTANVLKEAERAGVRRFIFVSSLGVERGQSAYHKSKLRAENLVQTFSREWVILRPGNVYGPGDDVISTLLKMVRVLPVVPMIDGGNQPFEPIWHEDLGRAIADAVTNPAAARGIYSLAGPDRTTTREVIEMFREITGRQSIPVPVPSQLADLATRLNEMFGGAGTQVMERLGLHAPLNSSKLQMLLEHNILPETETNALTMLFGVTPTTLREGLRRLADELPVITPSEGVGTVQRKEFWAEIVDPRYDHHEVMRLFRQHVTRIMPLNFEAEPGVPTAVELGATLTAALPLRGNIQVRVMECTEDAVTLLCVEGHPLAGAVRFSSWVIPGGIRFQIEVYDRPSDVLDWLAMRTIGHLLQDNNWVRVVERMVELSGGAAPAGVRQSTTTLTPAEADAVNDWVEGLVAEQKRREHALA